MRRYDDPVEVRRGALDPAGGVPEAPQQFLWHGRLWKVREVVAHWVETGAWWQSDGAHAVLGSDDTGSSDRGDDSGVDPGDRPDPRTGDLLTERELWRVEAGVGPASVGVFDLSFDWSDGCWQLVGCLD